MGEGDHFVQHLVALLIDVLQTVVRRGQRAFPNGEAVVMSQHILPELPQVVMDCRKVREVLHAVGHGQLGIGAGQARGLGDVGDHILPEAVHTHVQPEAENVLHFLTDFGVGHVQIRLLFGEQMQIIFV